MKYSRQRELILKTVLEHPCHPTADAVYTYLRQEYPTLSLATVYRNLNQLSDAGLLRRIPVDGGRDHFDGHTQPHYHLLCECCGEMADAPMEPLEGLDQSIWEKTGFRVSGHQLLFRGICPRCAARQEQGQKGPQ